MFIMNNEHRIGLKNISKDFTDKTLAELIQSGIGFHHAGLCSTDRNLAESLSNIYTLYYLELFRENAIFILTSTTTLALGVNLPAHLVIIKGKLLLISYILIMQELKIMKQVRDGFRCRIYN